MDHQEENSQNEQPKNAAEKLLSATTVADLEEAVAEYEKEAVAAYDRDKNTLRQLAIDEAAQAGFQAKMAASVEQATARAYRKFGFTTQNSDFVAATTGMAAIENLRSNPHMPDMQREALQAVIDSANNPHRLSMTKEAMHAFSDTRNNPYRAEMQASAEQVVNDTLNNPYLDEMQKLAQQTMADSLKNPHTKAMEEEVRKLLSSYVYPEPPASGPHNSQPNLEKNHEVVNTSKLLKEFHLSAQQKAEERQLITEKERVVIDGIAINIKKNRIKMKTEFNVKYNEYYPPTKYAPSLYLEQDIERKNLGEEWGKPLTKGIVELAKQSLDSRGSLIVGALYGAAIEGNKRDIIKLEKHNDAVDLERAEALYNQGHLNLKNDITKNISQSISSFSENENSSNITQKPIPSDVVAPVYSVLDKN